MNEHTPHHRGGLFSEAFYYAFRALFRPISRVLHALHITPNMVTVGSMVLGMVTGLLFALDQLWWGFIAGLATGFSDIVDGQLAKEYGLVSRFGAVLDSTIDRYVEFCVLGGLAARYYFQDRPWWILIAALVFLNSVMTSYIKARAEGEDIPCNAGYLQRPERLALIGLGVSFEGLLIDWILTFLLVGTQITIIQRIVHIRREAARQG